MGDAKASRESTRAQVDEQRLAKGLTIGLPLVTVSIAAVVAVLVGPATSILVVAAGILLGVIALLWGSLRILSGDAPLPPELEALDMASQGTSALATRKKMLLRALKDLENERAIGKIEDEDYEQISSTYRAELKTVLKRIDESLAPHRSKAEEAARAYLVKVGLIDVGYRGALPKGDEYGEENAADARKTETYAKADDARTPARVTCPKCGESNEPDAKFCKECATRLAAKKELVAESVDDEADGKESTNA